MSQAPGKEGNSSGERRFVGAHSHPLKDEITCTQISGGHPFECDKVG